MIVEALTLVVPALFGIYHEAQAGVYTRPALEVGTRCEQIKRHEITATNPNECEQEKPDEAKPLPEH